MSLLQVLLAAFRQNFHLDHSNAQVHCSSVRYSPLTFRLAEQIQVLEPHVSASCFSDVWMVLVDRGVYAEDTGR